MSLGSKYSCEGQMSLFDLDSWSGKMCVEHLAPTKEKTSDVSLKRQRKSQIKTPLFLDLRGGAWTPSGCILGDGWSIAWRVHDAQFWGVPQRRKRIALVADFGGQSAPEILFERKSVSGDIEQSGEERKDTPTTTERSSYEAISFQERAGKVGGGKGILIQYDRVGTLSTLNNQSVMTIGHDVRSSKFTTDGITDPLTATDYKDPIKVICLEGNGSRESHKGDGYKESDVMYTLNTVEQHAVCVEQ